MKEDKKFVNDVDQLTAQILMHIEALVKDEECEYYIELSDDNVTEFFTALNNAICHILRKTGMAKNFLQAQHVYNELLVQYLLKMNAKVEQ